MVVLKIAGLPAERMNIGPDHSARVLAVVTWGVVTMEERAGGQVPSAPRPWHRDAAWSREAFHWSHWVLPLVMLLISECPACSFSLDWNQWFNSVPTLICFVAWLAILMDGFSACSRKTQDTQSRYAFIRLAVQPWACHLVKTRLVVLCWLQWVLLNWTAEVRVALGYPSASGFGSTTELSFTGLPDPCAQGLVRTRECFTLCWACFSWKVCVAL